MTKIEIPCFDECLHTHGTGCRARGVPFSELIASVLRPSSLAVSPLGA